MNVGFSITVLKYPRPVFIRSTGRGPTRRETGVQLPVGAEKLDSGSRPHNPLRYLPAADAYTTTGRRGPPALHCGPSIRNPGRPYNIDGQINRRSALR